jgi:hypothetical protein
MVHREHQHAPVSQQSGNMRLTGLERYQQGDAKDENY